MSDIINPNKKISFTLASETDRKYIYTLSRALASMERLEILRLLSDKSMNISTIAQKLNLPYSSVSDHIAILEEAQILFVSTEQGPKRHIRMCSKQLNELTFLFYDSAQNNIEQVASFEIPVGLFSEAKVHAPCGMYTINSNHPERNSAIAQDSPSKLFHPERRNAELLWFAHGFVSYVLPNEFLSKNISKLELSTWRTASGVPNSAISAASSPTQKSYQLV